MHSCKHAAASVMTLICVRLTPLMSDSVGAASSHAEKTNAASSAAARATPSASFSLAIRPDVDAASP
eukprot:5526-Pelagococcus_subviridis.AAC.1